ncbi:MAG: cell division protein FtsQ/DivIB [bacterium]|nr:cell division protein FtsQ/DivIB [bacterium]
MRWNFRDKKITENISEPTFKNPLYNTSKSEFIYENGSLILFLTLLGALLIIYSFFYAPWFSIKSIEFKNLSTISPIKLTEDYLKPQLNSYNYIFTKQINIFSFSKDKLKNNISQEYNLESISIDKQLPNKVIITINEKLPTIIYSSNESKYFLDENGIITSKLSEDELNNENNLPVIVNLSNESTSIGQNIYNKEKLSNIISVINKTKNYSKLNILSYETPVLLSTQFNIYTEEGYKVYFDLSKDIEEQYNRLTRVLEDSDSTEPPTEYIDLRIGDRVYIK